MAFCAKRPGVLFLDVLVGSAVFAIVVSGVVYAILFSQQGMLRSGDRIRAIFLNQKAVTAVRAVRDRDFSSLEEGTFGVRLSEDGVWELSGSGVTTDDGFVTNITLVAVDDDRYSATAVTDWSFGVKGSGSTALTAQLSNWRRQQIIGDWSNASLDGAYTDDGTPLFNQAAIAGNYAFVTSEVSDGGVGLYVFDINNTAAPVRIADAFDLGAAGYDVLVAGNNLYVVTGDSSSEIRIYDISDPANFSSDDLLGNINVPGSGNARSIAFFDETLFIACAEDVGESELFTYDVLSPAVAVALDDLNDPGSSYADIRLTNGYAYLGNSLDTMELKVVDAFDDTNLQFAPDEGFNLTDTPDATSLVPVGDFLLLGRRQGDVTEELYLFGISSSPVPMANPNSMEAGADVNGVDADPTGAYAFAATGHDMQELLILNIATFAAGGNPIIDTYDTSTGNGRGVLYDILHDRVLLLTNSAVIFLKPA